MHRVRRTKNDTLYEQLTAYRWAFNLSIIIKGEAAMSSTRHVIDARDKQCPGPLMDLIEVMKQLHDGDEIELISSDVVSTEEVPTWLKNSGHRNLGIQEGNGVWHIFAKKGHK